jgi:hypothetical protein
MANAQIDRLERQLTDPCEQIEALVDMATVCRLNLYDFVFIFCLAFSSFVPSSDTSRCLEFRKTVALEGLNELTGLVASKTVVADFAQLLQEKEKLIEKLKLRNSALTKR